jgi:UDP-N-acetyl-2-amino-2-deoxyglucuronate dehydrogenase
VIKPKNSLPFQLSRGWLAWRVDFEEETATDPLPPEKQLRVGVVGGGDIGLNNAKSVEAAPAALVAAVCDVSPEVLSDMAKRLNVPAVPDYEKLLARSDVDAVLLSVPHMLHAPLAIQAAKAGKHVLLEKPLGVNLQDATRIVDACRQAGVRLTVNFSFRLRPAIQVARALVQEGVLGEISGIQISFLIFRGSSFWASGYTARAPGNWRGSKEKAGGGILILGICHAIDYVRFCTGLEVRRVSSEYGTFASPVEVEDVIVVNCQYDNGAIGSITASTCWRGKPLDEVRMWGTHGALRIEENNRLSFWSARRWRRLAAGREYYLRLPQIDYTANTARWIHRFAMALANNEPHEITGTDGWINNAIIEAAYRSRDRAQAEEVKTFPEKD